MREESLEDTNGEIIEVERENHGAVEKVNVESQENEGKDEGDRSNEQWEEEQDSRGRFIRESS